MKTVKRPIYKRAKGILSFAFCLMALSATSCATYQGKVRKARNELANGNPKTAAKTLEPLALQESKDQLVYLFDYATALQQAGDYQKSNQAYLRADEMAEFKDYHSISKVTGSLLLSEEMVQYKGENYEKVLINAMLAINFLLMNDLESALVETRRLNEKLDHFEVDGKKLYDQNVFAIYLGALIWEADRKWDDAYIDFNKAYKLNPDIPYLKEDLLRSALNARRKKTAKKWQYEFGIKPDPKWDDREYGELVLIYQQGWGPRKYPRPESPRFPKLYPEKSFTRQAKLQVEAGPSELTQEIYNVESVAIKTLEDAYSLLVAKRVAGIVAKEVVSDQIRQKNEALGNIAQLIMHMSDRADLRQWSTLPETFQIAKVRLKPGTYKVRALGLSRSGTPTGEVMDPIEVKIEAGRKSFIGWRSFE